MISAAAIELNAALDRKREATLKAQLALRGYAMHRVEDGYIVVKWNLSRHLASLEDCQTFAKQVGAA